MRSLRPIAYGLGLPALLVLSTGPAIAGKADRARAAIAEARGKIDTANRIGVSGDMPRMTAQAQAELRTAEENLASGHKDEAIEQAHHASMLADTAIGEANRARADASSTEQAGATAAALAAQDQAAAANARADAAEQAAAAASADAAAARSAPPVVLAAPTTTTVTTEESKPAARSSSTKRRTVHRTTRKAPVATAATKTTTTVTTSQ